MKKLILVLSALLCITAASGVLYSQDMAKHPGSDDLEKCVACHKAGIKQGNYTPLLANISQACLKCHERGDANHPIDRKPTFKVPADFPLSKNGEINCISCHKPHTDRYSDRSWQARSLAGRLGDSMWRKKQYKTYFLRRNNAHGELCLSCHGGQ